MELARVAAAHEQVHIATLRGLLADDAGPPPGAPWIPWLMTTAGLFSAAVVAIGLHRRRRARRVTIVGPDQGPAVSQHVTSDPGLAEREPDPQTARMPRSAARTDRT